MGRPKGTKNKNKLAEVMRPVFPVHDKQVVSGVQICELALIWCHTDHDHVCFFDPELILPSLALTYHKVPGVTIELVTKTSHRRVYVIKADGRSPAEQVVFEAWQFFTSPTHI